MPAATEIRPPATVQGQEAIATIENSPETPAPTAPGTTPTAVPSPTATLVAERPPKDLVVCMAGEPLDLYLYGTQMLVKEAVFHGLYENLITNLGYSYQAQGLENLPSLDNGDAVIRPVTVEAGDRIVDARGNVTLLSAGTPVITAAGEELRFDGTPLEMEQMAVDFTFKPLVWEDGTPVTAADSIYSFELAADPNTRAPKFNIERTARYEQTGELSVRWTGLPGFRDSNYFLNVWSPLPRHAWGAFTPAELTEAPESIRFPLANGPFRITGWEPGSHISLVRNEHYYRAAEGLPHVDSVTYRFIPNSAEILSQLLSGQCDIGYQDGVSVGQTEELLTAQEAGELVPYFQTGTVFEHIDFGIDSVPAYAESRPDWFADARVRQAMALCTDRQGMIDELMVGRSEIMPAYVPADHPLYPADLSPWPYDAAAGNALLDEAGWSDNDGDGIREDLVSGRPFSVTLATSLGGELRPRLAEKFREDMAECGINIAVNLLPPDQFFATNAGGPVFGRQFDLALFAWLAHTEPPCHLYTTAQIPGPPEQFPAGWAGFNNSGWSDERFDAACLAAQQALPGTAGHATAHGEAVRLFNEAVPSIPLFSQLKVAATRPQVINFHLDTTQPSELWNLYEIDLERID